MNEKISYMRKDINPRTWISPFTKNSVNHILKMALFYHIIGFALFPIGYTTSWILVPDYELPLIEASVVELILAGPIEESLFFGLPFYISGNQFVILATGIVWSFSHTLNITEEEISFSNLNYSNFFFVIPLLFFSLRTWRSGRGWLSILIHSAWNGTVGWLGCTFEDMECSVIGNNTDDIAYPWVLIAISIIMLLSTYFAYRRKKNRSPEDQSKITDF